MFARHDSVPFITPITAVAMLIAVVHIITNLTLLHVGCKSVTRRFIFVLRLVCPTAQLGVLVILLKTAWLARQSF